MDNNESGTQSWNSQTNQIRIEDINEFAFNTFKIFGLFLIKWNESECLYKVQRTRFLVYYLIWCLWPLAAQLGLSVWEETVLNSGDNKLSANDVLEVALVALVSTVVPTVNAFAFNLVTRNLPEVLEDIASLSDINVGFLTPLQIHLPKRQQKSLWPKKNAQETVRARKSDRTLFLFQILTVVVSILTFIFCCGFGLFFVAESDTLKAEWPFFIMQFVYITLPTITTWFNVFFIEWLRMVYEAMRVEAEYYYYSRLKISNHRESAPAPLTEEKIKLLGDYTDKLQEIFSGLSDGFIKYITGINFIVYIFSSVFCTVKLLDGFRQIMYMVPLSISLIHLALACYMSNSLMDEYHRVLSALKKVLRLERRNPTLLPYNELHILRENMLDSPPQVVIFGDFRVSNGLLIAVYGFILSYAVLVNDFINLRESMNKCNGTKNL